MVAPVFELVAATCHWHVAFKLFESIPSGVPKKEEAKASSYTL